MALFAAPTPTRSIALPAVVLIAIAEAAFIVLMLIPSPSATRPSTSTSIVTTTITTTTSASRPDSSAFNKEIELDWVRSQLASNSLSQDNLSPDGFHQLRKGINPRTREHQLQDLKSYKGISHYEGPEAKNHTAFPIPAEFLVEEHHSNYGEPWAGGRDVFDFLASETDLAPSDRVLEVGCGTLRVAQHFIRYLDKGHFHCLERDPLSIMGALMYELPSQRLTTKRPLIIRGEDMDFSKFGDNILYDLIYASAVFLHMPDKLVWVGIERLVGRLKADKGRIFISHNIKFCSRLGGEECTRRLSKLGLEYVGKKTHDSLLFNHYEIWFEFRRVKTSDLA